jgi:hypothetical protein
MPTIEDLRDVLATRAQAAVNADDVLSRALATPRRTRRAAPLVAALTVAGLAIGGAALGALSARTPRIGSAGQIARPDGHFTWQFAIRPIDGYTVTRTDSRWYTADNDPTVVGYQQIAQIDSSTHKGIIGSYVYEPASIDYPGNFLRDVSVAVTVGGEPGYFTPGRHVADVGLRGPLYAHPWAAVRDCTDFWPALRWQNGDGTWSLISGTFGFDPATYDFNNDLARSTLYTIAKSVRVGVDGGFCIDYVGPDDPIEGDSAVIACRFHTSGAAARLARETRGSALTRTLGDGTAFVLVFRSTNTDLSAAQRNTMLDDADVSPSLDDPSTWVSLTE